VGEASCAGMN